MYPPPPPRYEIAALDIDLKRLIYELMKVTEARIVFGHLSSLKTTGMAGSPTRGDAAGNLFSAGARAFLNLAHVRQIDHIDADPDHLHRTDTSDRSRSRSSTSDI